MSLTTPKKELQVLKAIQHARFVDGQDITKLHTLVSILKKLGLEEAVSMLENSNADLLNANHIRINRAKTFMREFGTRSVPTFIASSETKRWMLNTKEIYSNPNALFNQIQAA